MTGQTLATGFIVLLALAYLIRAVRRMAAGKEGCGCASTHCPKQPRQ